MHPKISLNGVYLDALTFFHIYAKAFDNMSLFIKKHSRIIFMYFLKSPCYDIPRFYNTKVNMSIREQFTEAQKTVKNLSKKPGCWDLLALYANFKQATDGDADGSRPSMTDCIARAKYDAWAALAGTQPEAAQQKYIELVDRLVKQDA